MVIANGGAIDLCGTYAALRSDRFRKDREIALAPDEQHKSGWAGGVLLLAYGNSRALLPDSSFEGLVRLAGKRRQWRRTEAPALTTPLR